jgi:hypothetical protein
MKYICKYCSYETDRLSSYNKHLMTVKHLEKVNNDTIIVSHGSESVIKRSPQSCKCPYCDKLLSDSSSLAKHKKTCSEKIQLETKYLTELEKKDLELKHFKELLKQEKQKSEEINKKSEEINKKSEAEIKHLKSLVHNTGSIIKTSVSALSYVTENYANAPVLMKLPDYTYIRNPKIDNDNDDDNDDPDDDEPFNLIEILIYHINKGILQEYLGMIVVEAYKKDDPAKQAIWNSDSSRLTYIIRNIFNKKPDWTVDKGGIKTTQQIIDPLLNFVRDEVYEFIVENSLPENVRIMSQYQMKKLACKLTSCSQIIASIDNKTMSKLVLKYIAPYFYLARPGLLVDTEQGDEVAN